MPRRLLSPRSLALAALMLAWVAGCALAAWWQVGRAFQGNQYSYLYAIEWPVFAIVGVFAWWTAQGSDAATRAQRASRRDLEEARRAEQRVTWRDRGDEDPDLAAYNDHLAELALSERRKTWRG